MADQFPLSQKPVRSDHRNILRIEKNLNSIGFFTPANKRSPGTTAKTVKVFVKGQDGSRVEATATIYASPEFGLPITSDQDKYYAFTKILEAHRLRSGSIQNPVAFTSAEMLKVLGRKKSGKSYKEIDEWLDRMTATTIRSEGVVWLSGRKRYARDTFHAFERSVRFGEELSDGQLAEKNYVWLSSWLLDNINNNYVLPIDYEIYRMLRYPISKALVPLLQIWFFASRRNSKTTVEKRYCELCELLSVRRTKHLSKIRETMEPSLTELKSHKLLEFWSLEKTVDGIDFKLVLAPGERYLSERQARLQLSGHQIGFQDAQFTAQLLEMTKRGIHEDVARRVLLNVPDTQDVLTQLNYGDFEIFRRARTQNPIKNPPGFYRFLIENNVPVPESFALQQAQTTRAQQPHITAALHEEFQKYRYEEAEKYIAAHFTQEQVQQKLQIILKDMMKADEQFQYLPKQTAQSLAEAQFRVEIEPKLDLMSFEEFCAESQLRLPLA